jgi:anti-sigma factor RsiW
MNEDKPSPGPHARIEELLPWYVTGQLDESERVEVERHLAGCAECEKELRAERRLVEEYRSWTPNVEQGWERLRARVAPLPAARRDRKTSLASNAWRSLSRPAVAAVLAARLAIVVLAGGVISYITQPPAYHVLGAAPVPTAANAVVVFKPDTREEQLRALLSGSDATLVGGPTDADAYLLNLPQARRAQILAKLRARPEIVMAEPIDGQVR